MMSNLQKLQLSDICTGVSYGYTESANEEVVGPKFLRITDIQGGVVNWGKVPYCPIDEDKISKYLLEYGDIVVARTGNSTGENYAYKGKEQSVFASYLIRFRINKLKANPFFVWYHMRSQCWRDFVASSKSGSAQAGANAKILGTFEITLPSLSEQNEIVSYLENIDDKIELNRQTNQTLEQIAQAIFKSWFVDFEPTRAKIKAKKHWQAAQQNIKASSVSDYAEPSDKQHQHTTSLQEAMNRAAMAAISGKTEAELNNLPADTLQQLRTTAELFPDTLVESELGEIPAGWEASTLGAHFNVVMGQSPKGDTYNEDGKGMIFFQGRRDFGFRFPTARVYTTDPKRFALAGDTLISVRAPVGDKNMALERCCLGRGVAGIRHKSGARSFTYSFISYIENSLSNSGSDGTVFNSINKLELKAVPFIAPSDSLVNKFESLIYASDQRVEVLSKEIESLEQLRDTLLPKLLSGELSLDTNHAKNGEVI